MTEYKYILIEDKSYWDYEDRIEVDKAHYFRNDAELLAFYESRGRYITINGIYAITPVKINTSVSVTIQK